VRTLSFTCGERGEGEKPISISMFITPRLLYKWWRDGGKSEPKRGKTPVSTGVKY
jgi:hypothetical protein